ncbi:helix-turn-helix domain-containing protein [Carboxylicivirga sp. N1Y90]|uniref:helix-turn-helix domain-containing protein n=1 Tax=Carboxylicivirga fragile TaxID=3417571 RepID=UPI003D348AE2|nr:helix-turn-helix domain-containing protein [Marinilabiliaceae bacterium N1Y90]
MENEFLNQIKALILQNISNDKFGVAELAYAAGMSRSNLLRKIQKYTGDSVSIYIRKIRLDEASKLLRQDAYTVSEVSYRVGFSSASYFIKCFREHYGYPPGEMNNKARVEKDIQYERKSKAYKKVIIFSAAFLVPLIIWILVYSPFSEQKNETKKSIAVLPFKNDSNDSTNVYIVNGLMESILDNLQQLEGLKVISRTSVEKYRNSKLSIPEIAEELNVSYFIEGSGQKIGDNIRLSVQLIEARADDHIWSEQYNRQINDIFDIQTEVAKQVANQIQVHISPEEEERISQLPTDNIEAYELFLQGIDLLNEESKEGLYAGIPYLHKAIELDSEFARAHAALALAYYYVDLFEAGTVFSDSLNYYADKALLHNPKLAQGLTAKALYYIDNNEYGQAVTYLEKALEYNPNSALVINTLSDLYGTHIPNTELYLEYALKGVSLDIASNDSSTASYTYLHLSNALIQTGFTDEAIRAINKSLANNPNNLFSEYVRAYILYAKHKDLKQTKELLIEALEKDPSRFDIMQEIGNACYYMRDWEESYSYFKQFIAIKEALQLDVYVHKTAEIGLVYEKMGFNDEANQFMSQFKSYLETDESTYTHLNLALYYSYLNKPDKAFEHLRLFSKEENFQYWIILFIPMDPLVDNIKDDPEFDQLMEQLENNFWQSHNRIKKQLLAKDLLDF